MSRDRPPAFSDTIRVVGAFAGGGFLLLFVEPDKQADVRRALGDRLHVPFRFESEGSQVIFYEPQPVAEEEDAPIAAFKELALS